MSVRERMRGSFRIAVALAVATASALALTACLSGQAYSDLDRPKTDADALPSLSKHAAMMLDLDSARYLGAYRTMPVFAARSSDGTGYCLIVNPTPDVEGGWLVGCGGGAVAVEPSRGPTFRLVPDGAEAADGEQLISANLIVDPRTSEGIAIP